MGIEPTRAGARRISSPVPYHLATRACLLAHKKLDANSWKKTKQNKIFGRQRARWTTRFVLLFEEAGDRFLFHSGIIS